jgi:hypothetical protein
MRNYRTGLIAASLGMLSIAGTAWADEAPAAAAPAAPAADAAAPAAAKPVLPSISDLLDASGITATGYVSGTFGYETYSASAVPVPPDYSTFTLQQAAFTLAKQPTAGFGALVNVIAGQNIYTANYSYNGGISKTSTQFQLAQGFAQYAVGPVTVMAGKFVTLAGAEVLASSGNTNITRSLLYSYEPVTHTGARLTYAPTSTLSLIVGVNNGWIYSDELAASGGKTLEAGLAWTPSKAFSLTVQGYTGDDTNFAGVRDANHSLIDGVATWNATAALSLIASVDWGQVGDAFGVGTGSASWTGVAGYVNYAINDTWRVSLRGEYFDDNKGYLTAIGPVGAPLAPGKDQKLDEGTITFGYDPTKNVELRVEGRYDTYDAYSTKVAQGWLEALYKF